MEPTHPPTESLSKETVLPLRYRINDTGVRQESIKSAYSQPPMKVWPRFRIENFLLSLIDLEFAEKTDNSLKLVIFIRRARLPRLKKESKDRQSHLDSYQDSY